MQAQSTTASISQGQDDVGDAGGIGGTPAYMAPELLDPDAEANYASDVYSFGIMMVSEHSAVSRLPLTSTLIPERNSYGNKSI